jgi:hypothetical protein
MNFEYTPLQQYQALVFDLAAKEHLNNIFVTLCSLHIANNKIIDDPTFTKQYFAEICSQHRGDSQKGQSSPSPRTADFNRWYLEDAEETFLQMSNSDREMIQQQANNEQVFSVKRYHVFAYKYMIDDIGSMKEKYKADSINEIVTHLLKDLKPIITQIHKIKHHERT